ncbi:113_t:CDS:2, partial [Acaulospora colombiana]
MSGMYENNGRSVSPSSSGNNSLHHNNNSSTSQNTASRNQQWLDETVQQRRVKFIPYEEFEDERMEERGDKEHGSGGINNTIKTMNWKKMRKRVVVKELENVSDLSDETREAFVTELKLHLQVESDEKIIRISGLSQGEWSRVDFPSSIWSADSQKSGTQGIGEEFTERAVGGKAKSIRSMQSMNSREKAEELTNRIIRGVREQAVKDTPNVYYGLYNKCWQSSPTARPTSQEVVRELRRLSEGGLTSIGSRGVEDVWVTGGEGRVGEERFTGSQKKSRISEIADLAELRKDALAAELWLHYQEIAEKSGKSFSVGDFEFH